MSKADSQREKISFIVSYMDMLTKDSKDDEKNIEEPEKIEISPPEDELKNEELINWLGDKIEIANHIGANVKIEGLSHDKIDKSGYDYLLAKISSFKNEIVIPGLDLDEEKIKIWRDVVYRYEKPKSQFLFDKLKNIEDKKEGKLNKAKFKALCFFHDKVGKSIINTILIEIANLVPQKTIAKNLNLVKEFVEYNSKKFNYNQVNNLYNLTISFIDNYIDNSRHMERLEEQSRRISKGNSYLEISIKNNTIHEKVLTKKDATDLASNKKSSNPNLESLPVDININSNEIVLKLRKNKKIDKRLLLTIYNLNGKAVFTKSILFDSKKEMIVDIVNDANLFPGGYIYHLIDEDLIQYKKELFGESYLNKTLYLPNYDTFEIGADIYDLGDEYSWTKTIIKGKEAYKPAKKISIGVPFDPQ